MTLLTFAHRLENRATSVIDTCRTDVVFCFEAVVVRNQPQDYRAASGHEFLITGLEFGPPIRLDQLSFEVANLPEQVGLSNHGLQQVLLKANDEVLCQDVTFMGGLSAFECPTKLLNNICPALDMAKALAGQLLSAFCFHTPDSNSSILDAVFSCLGREKGRIEEELGRILRFLPQLECQMRRVRC